MKQSETEEGAEITWAGAQLRVRAAIAACDVANALPVSVSADSHIRSWAERRQDWPRFISSPCRLLPDLSEEGESSLELMRQQPADVL